MLLVSKGHLKVDEVRRGVEALEPEVYAKAAYYEKCHGHGIWQLDLRWAGAVTTIMLERQLLSHEELGRELQDDDSPDARLSGP